MTLPTKDRETKSNSTSLKDTKSTDTIQDPYVEPSFFTKLAYDLTVFFLSFVFNCFFREIRPRGAFRIPQQGPVIFVAGPHANQFVDPGILLKQVREETKRRVSFLIAASSLKISGISQLARLALSIPVKRAQDNLKVATGTIELDATNPLKIIGHGTKFTQEAMVKGLLGLPQSQGNVEVSQIINDEELLIRKEFKPKAAKILSQPTSFKLADKIDQHEVYEKVYAHLRHGQCIGIFPEGGSHDRTDLLPLKAGVAIMALGAMAHNNDNLAEGEDYCDVKIVPCGMNYFHAHKFRSRAVIEFGQPITIPKELVAKYKNPETAKAAVSELLEIVEDGLRAVTVTCPDYETLMCVQAARRLYTNEAQIPIPFLVEWNRRLVKGYEHFKDDPAIKASKERILKYNENLKNLNLPDHEVERAQLNYFKNLFILLHRTVKLVTLIILASPGFLLFTPVFVVGKWYSGKKQKTALANSVVKIQATDVIATWKILIGMGLAPLLYIFYSVLGLWYFESHYGATSNLIKRLLVFFTIYWSSATVTYSALIIGDTGMDIFKSIRPIYLSLVKPSILQELKAQREELKLEIIEAVNKFGPILFKDFDHLKSLDYDEQVEDLKTKRMKRLQERRRAERKNVDSAASASDSDSISNASLFNDTSDAESGYDSETSYSERSRSGSLGSIAEAITDIQSSSAVSGKIIDALRERRNTIAKEEEDVQ
ncbi:hypothetical protein WICPIJ_003259 [Wickerhamomyces pijperi]|uniref:Phospholipid/glycerol acyltransferase domain-containing protein n=1 Tax=Wickerhamomyces pijperi TaxID=599730 RepID=A0A9P8QA99_WICPI|nr:hypothetical protein WICPIJ_003259 [Wickerhamomyces pijperi]